MTNEQYLPDLSAVLSAGLDAKTYSETALSPIDR
jgi:hypothetical protein